MNDVNLYLRVRKMCTCVCVGGVCVSCTVTLFHYPLVSYQASIEQCKTQYLEVLKENTRRLNKVSELQHTKKEVEKRLNARQKTMVGVMWCFVSMHNIGMLI